MSAGLRLLVMLSLAGCHQLFGLTEVEGIDASSCPDSYDVTVPMSTSRYRVLELNTAYQHHIHCANDAVGITHLAVMDSSAELQAVYTTLTKMSVASWNVGAVQVPGAVREDDGWLWVTGGNVEQLAWAPGEPNDTDFTENSQEDIAYVKDDNGPGMTDASNFTSRAGLCECDGHPVDPIAQMAFEAL